MYITINLKEYTISSNEKRRIVVPDGTIMRHSEIGEEIGVDGHGNDGGYDGGAGE